MPSEDELEVYRQRYETFRHLDRMRFHMLQILVAVGTAIALFYRFHTNSTDWLEWWVFLLIGAILLLIGWTMLRVSNGLWANNKVLYDAAAKIGDSGIPKTTQKWKSPWCWLSVIVQILGGLLLLNGLIKF